MSKSHFSSIRIRRTSGLPFPLTIRHPFVAVMILLAVASALPSHYCQAGELVVPIINGNAQEWEPFAFDIFSEADSTRYQQVYDASVFTSVAPLGGIITGLAFQPATGNIFWEDIPSLQVDLCVTSNGPDNLSAVFSDNLSGNVVTVFDAKKTDLFSVLQVTVPLDRPYFYDPSAGNLLMDVRIVGRPMEVEGHPYRSLDAESTVGDVVSRVYGGTVDSPSGIVDSVGLVTWFTIEPIPEPSPLLLFLALGLVALASSFIRKRHSSES